VTRCSTRREKTFVRDLRREREKGESIAVCSSEGVKDTSTISGPKKGAGREKEIASTFPTGIALAGERGTGASWGGSEGGRRHPPTGLHPSTPMREKRLSAKEKERVEMRRENLIGSSIAMREPGRKKKKVNKCNCVGYRE